MAGEAQRLHMSYLWIAAGTILAEIFYRVARPLYRQQTRAPQIVSQTEPPGNYMVLYDGHCKFCQAQIKNLEWLAKPKALMPLSFQGEGTLASFPGVTYEACMEAMQLITPTGRVYQGAAAVAHAMMTRPIIGLLGYGYYLPGVHMVCDGLYAFIAANRYRLMGKQIADGECSEACAVHLKK
jgi:predicted DCC family thiol-disulfide oxidoreductase YuxK